MKQVYFVGAGPGDPDLITIKGAKCVEMADVIIYAGSLVNPEVLKVNKKNATIYNSATMSLEEVLTVIKEASQKGQTIARVHTGDPSIYGAIQEQMDALEEMDILYEVIPGVSSFTAAAASIKREFTLPGVTQTVICTRLAGRTAVPDKEKLEDLAKHRASMAIFLSVGMIEEVAEQLMTHYPVDTPVAVVKKASWIDEEIVLTTLDKVAEIVKRQGIHKTAQILVGDFISTDYEKSKLYDKAFSHEYRKGTCV